MEPTVKKTNRFSPFIFAAALIALLAGCSSTRVVDSWKDPSFDPSQFQKTLVVFQHPDPGGMAQGPEQLRLGQEPHPAPGEIGQIGDGEGIEVGQVVRRQQQRAVNRDALHALDPPAHRLREAARQHGLAGGEDAIARVRDLGRRLHAARPGRAGSFR